MTGHKQRHILSMAVAKGSITINDVRRYYSIKGQAMSSMTSLEILGYLKKETTPEGYIWKYTGKK